MKKKQKLMKKEGKTMLMQEEREQIVEYGKKMSADRLTSGTSGNISIYNAEKGYMAVSTFVILAGYSCVSMFFAYRIAPVPASITIPDSP